MAGAVAFAVFEPIQVLPRIRLAPGFALESHTGAPLTSESARGSVTLYTFSPLDCGDECARIDQTMAEVERGVAEQVDLGEVDFRLVSISLDPVASGSDLAAAAERSGADGVSWQWAGSDADTIRRVVGDGFRRFYETDAAGSVRFDPAFVLVDGNGVIRGEYRYRTLADDGAKMIRHVDILADELRYSDGAGAVAYEAAHLFLCYG